MMLRISIAVLSVLATSLFASPAIAADDGFGKPFVGLQYGSVQDIRNEFQGEIEIPKRKGVLITRVMKRSPADEAGLKPLDIIIAINKIPVPNEGVFGEFLKSIEIGKKYRISVVRPKRSNGRLRWTVRGQVALTGKTFRETALTAVKSVKKNGETLYRHQDSPKSLNTQSDVELYFNTKNGDADQLRMKITYVGEKHLNINRFLFKYGDKTYEIDASKPEEVLRDKDGLDFWEWWDQPIENAGLAAIANITQQRAATLTYTGSDGSINRKLSSDEIDRLLLVLVAYQLRKKQEPKDR